MYYSFICSHHIKYNLGCSFWVIRHEACIKCEAIKEDVLTFMSAKLLRTKINASLWVDAH